MNVVIMGSGAIGCALAEAILARYPASQCLITYYRNPPSLQHRRLRVVQCAATEEHAFQALSAQIAEKLGSIQWLINTIGILHSEADAIAPEKRLSQFDATAFERVMRANVLPTMFAAKHLLKRFDRQETTIFATISAKVGSIEDNRLGGWYSYRASKAGLNMMLKTIAIEQGYKNKKLCVLALHPGTTDSKLSEPFQAGVPAHKLFSPAKTANYLLDVLARARPENTGSFYSWDGSVIPW
ncbi:MAG TPA: SDR family NAD(P)-dependent oxidoreductase [Marinagarivorans sp.]